MTFWHYSYKLPDTGVYMSETAKAIWGMLKRNPKVAANLVPSAIRGFVKKEGRKGKIGINSKHDVLFDFEYDNDGNPEFLDLYVKAQNAQWKSSDLPWDTDVDPMNPEFQIFPVEFLPEYNTELWEPEKAQELTYNNICWTLSQFLHGEQGALYAAAQTVEATPWLGAKFYGATQVQDEARHVEVFHKYLMTKLNKVYEIDDNLYTVIHSLTRTGDWDLKFLGMQIMIEGLALGAFGFIYRYSKEPLLKALLKNVIADEARHVHYGVAALRDFYTKEVSEKFRRNREDWAYEVAIMLRNRFLFLEVYYERYTHKISEKQWIDLIMHSPSTLEFRRILFSRLIPNLREIGLLTERIQPAYEKMGLMQYYNGVAADRLTQEDLLCEIPLTPNEKVKVPV